MTPRHDSDPTMDTDRAPSAKGSLEHKLMAYSAAAGVALAGAAAPGAADAQIVYSPVDPDVTFQRGQAYGVDFDQDGTPEVTLSVGNAGTTGTQSASIWVINGVTTLAESLASAYVAQIGSQATYAAALSEGDPISSNQTFQLFSANQNGGNYGFAFMGTYFGPPYMQQGAGVFPGAGDKYFGVRTKLSSETSGNQYYGWVRLSVTQNITSATVSELAYNSTPGAAINAGQIPVELASFSAQAAGEGAAQLRWQTLSETGNAGFEVQMKRKLDGAAASYEKVGYVPTAVQGGTTTEAQDYSFSVEGLEPGTYQFRLKQIDIDGNSELHGEDNPVSVEISLAGSHTLSSAYPNPFSGQTRFDLNVAETQEVTVSLYNTLGQEVRTLHSGTIEEGATRAFTLEAGDLASGVYIYRVEGETFSDSGTVTLVR